MGATQLSRAESEARAAAAGIKSGQATYVDAENAAVAGKRNYSNRLAKGGSIQQIEAQIRKDYDSDIRELRAKAAQQRAQIPPGASPGDPVSNAAMQAAEQFDAEADLLERDKANEITRAHNAFKNGIQGSGIEESVKNNFGTFDNFRRNASKGISESNAVAEAAAGASTNAKFSAISNGLAMATQIGQLNALRRLRQNLGDIEPQAAPTPVVALGVNPNTPTVPDIPPGAPRDVEDPDFAFDGELGEGNQRGNIRGSVRTNGKQFAQGNFKPRRATVSGSGSAGGAGGGGGAGASRAPSSQRGSGPRGIDYGGGGGGLPGGGGGVAVAQGDTDFQDALRSLLGGEKEQGDGGADFDYYRKVASSRNGSGDEEESGDPRSIFERVKTKYNDVVSRGVI